MDGSKQKSTTLSGRAATSGAFEKPEKFFSFSNGSAKGTWYVIHLLGANGKKEALNVLLQVFSERFMCPKCRPHIKSYVSKHPMPNGDRALFNWTVAFHNEVTARVSSEQKMQLFALTEEGANELFKQLTVGADEDGSQFRLTGDCDGCAPPSKPEQKRDIARFTE